MKHIPSFEQFLNESKSESSKLRELLIKACLKFGKPKSKYLVNGELNLEDFLIDEFSIYPKDMENLDIDLKNPKSKDLSFVWDSINNLYDVIRSQSSGLGYYDYNNQN